MPKDTQDQLSPALDSSALVSSELAPDMEIVVDPEILVPRKYLRWQKIFGLVTTLNHKIDYNVR